MATFKGNIPYSRLMVILVVVCLFHFDYYLVSAQDFNISNTEESICENAQLKTRNRNAFSWVDYIVLATMLVVSCGIGIFYGFFGPKHENSEDFLLGGSTMGTFPMAMSLAASFVTAVELLGNPAEMYTHGSQFWMICIPFILVVPLTSKLYLPVFMNLRLTSSYEYLSMRFSPKTRYLASGLYIFQMVLYTSVAVYAPALALSSVTGLNVYLAVTAVYAVCIFYASQGGMKAVIIADTFQAAVLLGSILLIMYLGEQFLGNQGVIWSQSYYTDRLELFNFNPSLTIRHSFWSVVVGGTFYWMTMFCSNQASIQKYLSVERISQVRKALWVSCGGLILIYTINFYTGMILVAHYKTCDPITSKEINASDEILPLYIITIMGHFKGLTGFFVAGMFAASLGTVASALNSLAAVTMQDFLGTAFGVHLPDRKGALVAKVLSIAYGAISFGLVFIVAQLGSVMQVAISFNGIAGGVTLGLFSLGMFFPWANSRGAIFGSLVAVALVTLMCIGQQISIANGTMKDDTKPMSTEKCPCYDQTVTEVSNVSEPVYFIFRISYIWYSAIGFLITFILGVLGSLATGPTNYKDVDGDLLSPPVRSLFISLPNRVKDWLNIPLKDNSGTDTKRSVVKEAFTINLDLFDREKKQNIFNEQVKSKIRKISAPS
ncbi:sodium-coupled monocarboxylate transporter 1-like isoform X2 [Anoplophora glabripennis]|nr:sodium-coupled monocarboxylate transporter 1-like isoform X2 [Anoplophora glabripennis]